MNLSNSTLLKIKQNAPDLRDVTLDKGSSLVGYSEYQNVRESLDNVVDARVYGFRTDADASVNMTAVSNAIAASNGRPVIIEATSDFEMGRLSFPDLNTDINLQFRGPGYRNSPSNGPIGISCPFAGIQNVSQIISTTTVINNITEPVTRLTVTDTTEYQEGDWIKVVSDDLDPNARNGYSARRGESCVVVKVDSPYIYIADSLEDAQYYVTNIRVGRYSRAKVTIRGLKIRSGRENVGQAVFIANCVSADVELFIEGKHNGNGIASWSCVTSRFKVCGDFSSGQSEDTNTKYLTYSVADGCGTLNTIYDSVCRGQRHLVTTSFPSVSENGDLRLYGATKDLTVRDCISIGGQNVPFDGHEGDRRTRFINCSAFGTLNGTNDKRVAFQIRGGSATIIDCNVDHTHDSVVGIGSSSFGTHHLIGGTSRSPVVYRDSTTVGGDLVVENHVCELEDIGSQGFFYVTAANVTIRGGRYSAKSSTIPSQSMIRIMSNGTIRLENSEFLFVDNDSSLRLFNLYEGARITGDAILRNMGTTPLNRIFHGDSNPSNLADCNFIWMSGTYTSVRSSAGVIPSLSYTIKDLVKTPTENVSSQQTYKASASSVNPSYPRDMVFKLDTDTSLIVKVMGSDGVVRTATIVLS